MSASVEEIKAKIQKVANVNGKLTSYSNNYIDQIRKVVKELKELRENEESIPTKSVIDEVISLHEDILIIVEDHKDESIDKMKDVADYVSVMLQIKRDEETKSKQERQLHMTDNTRETEDRSALSSMVEKYCQTGAFITHLPQFLSLVNLVVKQYQRKAPKFG